MSEAFGIMDSAYFVNKNDILKWINTTLKLQIEKIDQLGAGSVYCQLLDMIYPGSVCMSKVNWKAKLEYEYLNNFKIVTTCLEKNDVKKHVDVNKLVKCRYQDNLEFAQWFKKFFDLKGGDRSTEYDAETRRGVKVTMNATNDLPKPARKEQQKQLKNAGAVAATGTGAAAAATTTATTTSESTATTKTAESTTAEAPSQPTVPAETKDTKVITKAVAPATASKVVHSTIPSHSVIKKAAGNTTSTTSKPSTAVSGTNSLNNKRTFNQMQGQSSTKGKTPATQVASTVKTASIPSKNNQDYNLLISSLSEILNSGQSDVSIITKIKQLVKDNGNNVPAQSNNPTAQPEEGNGKETIIAETAPITQATAEQLDGVQKDESNTAIQEETA